MPKKAVFTTSQPDDIAPAIVNFKNAIEGADSVHWGFGDGTSSHTPNPSHRYGSSGNYLVQQTVYSGSRERTYTKKIQIKPPIHCLVEITTPYGTMVVRLSEGTPKHRRNFIRLVEKGFYDSLLFHRVIAGFMIQGGDPESRNAERGAILGRGGPGYVIPAEISDTLVHLRGALAAARKGDQVNPQRNSSGSQFYIVVGRDYNSPGFKRALENSVVEYSSHQLEQYKKRGGTPFLDGKYTVFGYMVSGYDVLDEISQVATDGHARPVKDVWMTMRVVK